MAKFKTLTLAVSLISLWSCYESTAKNSTAILPNGEPILYKSDCGPESSEFRKAKTDLQPWLFNFAQTIKANMPVSLPLKPGQEYVACWLGVGSDGKVEKVTFPNQTEPVVANQLKRLVANAAPYECPPNNLPSAEMFGVVLVINRSASGLEAECRLDRVAHSENPKLTCF